MSSVHEMDCLRGETVPLQTLREVLQVDGSLRFCQNVTLIYKNTHKNNELL